MRKAGDVDKFPYLSKNITYYEAIGSEIFELTNHEDSIKTAYIRAIDGKSNLYATWHGTYRTDMFFIDDLHELGLALGFEQAEHEHEIIWKCENPQEKGAYVSVEIEFACGCAFDTEDGIYRLKKELAQCKGWDMSASYLGKHNGKYLIRVKKNTIDI